MIKDKLKIIIILIFTLILGFIIYSLSLGYILNLTNIKSTNPSQSRITLAPFGPITNTNKVDQYFKAEHNNLLSLEVAIGTYNKKLTGLTCFTVQDITKNNTFYNNCLPNKTFLNDQYYTINFNEQLNVRNDKMLLEVTSPTKTSSKAIALFRYNSGFIGGYKLYINNKLQNQNLAFNQIYNVNNSIVKDGLSQTDTRYPDTAILKGDTLKQYFKPNHSNLGTSSLKSVQIAIGNYSRVNNSLFCIKLENITKNNTFYNKCIVSTDFVNNQYYTINFPEQKNIKNNEMLMSIFAPNATANNAVTVFLYNNYLPGYKLYSNNTLLDSNIDFIQVYNLNYGFFKSFNIIYNNLVSQNPYILKGYYIYLFFFIYPVVFTILIFLLECYLLKDKSIKNIVITNLIFLLIFFGIVYYMSNLQNLTIGCYPINYECVGTTVPSSF